jgi:acetyl esterase
MRRTGKVMRRMPGASVALATDEEIARNSGASAPELMASILQGKKPRGVTTEDRTVEGIPIRVYRPSSPSRASGSASPSSPSRASGSARPLIVYFHGGGFVFGSLRGGDWICGTVAKELDAIVVSVQYRLAPTNPFPAGIDDCYEVLEWVAANAEPLGADANRLGVMGESSGGNLAAVVALMARDRKGPVIRHQALLYPATGAGDTESRRANADAFILTRADMQKFGELYGGDPTNWRVSPIVAKSFKNLPPAIVVVGGHDPLHDDGTLYADALSRAGVATELLEYPAMPHGFLNFPRFARDAKPAIAAVIESQRQALAMNSHSQ